MLKRAITILMTMTIFAAAAFADLARPDKTPNRVKKPAGAVDTTMRFSLKADAKEARLLIPRSQLNQLRAELERLDGGDDATAAAPVTGSQMRLPTIMSGVFLSLAIVFGGLWLFRSGRGPASRSGLTGAAFVIAAVGLAATFAYANAGPPLEARSITGKMFSQSVHIYKTGWGRIKLEVKETGEDIELIVPDAPTAPTPAE